MSGAISALTQQRVARAGTPATKAYRTQIVFIGGLMHFPPVSTPASGLIDSTIGDGAGAGAGATSETGSGVGSTLGVPAGPHHQATDPDDDECRYNQSCD